MSEESGRAPTRVVADERTVEVPQETLERDEDRAPVEERPRRVFHAGQLVAGHFEVVRPLGEGGMGEVFVARDTRLGRRVALKTLKLPEGVGEQERVRFDQLFERDAASTAQLNHPCIVSIHHFGEHEGTPFFVLELVDGDPLDEVLGDLGPLSEREVIELAVQLCDALDHAHAHGVIHRDIKPANLMRTKDGRLKVLDFGIALMKKARGELEEAFGASSVQLDSRLGREPLAAGTPRYMAPEQLRGLEQDARADVWAVGVTLFELLTGETPYASPFTVNEQFVVRWPQDHAPSPQVRGVIEGCLAFSVDERTPSMRELSRRLTEAHDALTAPMMQPWRREKRTNLVPFEDAFIGREADLERLDERVFGEAHRVVGLVGPGGVGKTRLVTQWGARAMEREWVQEVVFCALTESTRADDVLVAIGQALDVPLTQRDPAAQLGYVLERRAGLVLILDNCEHIADDVAGLLTAWVPSLEHARVVFTSRVDLEVRGAQHVSVQPFEGVESAAALYEARARQVSSAWVCAEDERGALEALVDELDRLPLAIELAAARVKVLPPSKMLERLGQRFKLLRSNKKGVSARQATLRGAIEWSWGLLDSAQRLAMAQMSVFQGAFTLEALEEVLDLTIGEDEPFGDCTEDCVNW